LTPHEAAALRALPGDQRPAALSRLWCLKEACVKATGEGLAADLSRIGFVGQGHAVRLDAAPAAPDGPWHFEHRVFPDGSHAALAVRCPPGTAVRVRWRRWSVARLARRLARLHLQNGPGMLIGHDHLAETTACGPDGPRHHRQPSCHLVQARRP